MVRETHQAALLLPTGPPGSKFIDPGPTIDPALLATPISTPAGDGYIVDSTYLSPRSQREFMLKNYWFEKKGREQITVYAGYDGVEQDQGTIYVSRPGAYRLERFDTPTRAGAVTIIDAIGEVLILESENGSTFYFNIPGLRYVQTPEEVVPTVTPEPTRTPDPLILEVLGSDDAPNFPGQLFSNRAINMDLQYLIDYAGDEDWFSFQVFYPGEVSFVLSDLPEDYRFVIFYNGYHAQTTRIGEDLDAGTGDKQFYLPDAVVGEYLVVVFGDDNSFNATAPYTIHFRAPNPYPVLPLLHCVERVAEGEYIAHFGYENRYDFVRVIPVGRANYLDPPPRDRLQLTIFNLGREEDSFEVNFDGSPLIWYLDQSSVAASENSPSCTALSN